MLVNLFPWKKHAPVVRYFDGGINLEDPAVKEAIEKIVSEQTAGLKKNRDDLLEEKRKLGEKFQELETRWAPLKEFDPTMLASILERFEKDEEAKLIAAGKLDEVLNRRTDAMRKDAEKLVLAAQERATAFESATTALKGRIAQLVIGAKIRESAVKLGLAPTAIADAERDGMAVFDLDENENPVMHDVDGTLVLGKDGKSPKPPAEWLDGMREAKPHWWPPSGGGGAGGGGDRQRRGNGLDLEKMSPRDKLMVGLDKQSESAT
jgi:hypothetical protein